MPTRTAKRPAKMTRAVPAAGRWKLEDAKARLSEVVRLAGTAGPQLVTIRGKEAAIILAPEDYRQLLPKPKGRVSLVQFLQSIDWGGLDADRVLERSWIRCSRQSPLNTAFTSPRETPRISSTAARRSSTHGRTIRRAFRSDSGLRDRPMRRKPSSCFPGRIGNV